MWKRGWWKVPLVVRENCRVGTEWIAGRAAAREKEDARGRSDLVIEAMSKIYLEVCKTSGCWCGFG